MPQPFINPNYLNTYPNAYPYQPQMQPPMDRLQQLQETEITEMVTVCGAIGFGLSFSSCSPGEAGAMASAATVQMARDSRVLLPEQISMRALL